MGLLQTYNFNIVKPIFDDNSNIARAIGFASIAAGFYAAGTLLCWTAAGAWEVWAYANDPAVKGMATAVVERDTNITSNGVIFADSATTVPDRGGYQMTFPVWMTGSFDLADILSSQRSSLTTANLGASGASAKMTGLKLRGANVVALI